MLMQPQIGWWYFDVRHHFVSDTKMNAFSNLLGVASPSLACFALPSSTSRSGGWLKVIIAPSHAARLPQLPLQQTDTPV